MSNEQPDAKVIPFPRQLRVVPIQRRPYDPPEASVDPVTVKHNGRTYVLAPLLRQLPSHCIQESFSTARWSWQELWDEVCGVGRGQQLR